MGCGGRARRREQDSGQPCSGTKESSSKNLWGEATLKARLKWIGPLLWAA